MYSSLVVVLKLCEVLVLYYSHLPKLLVIVQLRLAHQVLYERNVWQLSLVRMEVSRRLRIHWRQILPILLAQRYLQIPNLLYCYLNLSLKQSSSLKLTLLVFFSVKSVW